VSSPVFNRQGKFDRRAYEEFLRRNRLDEKGFEEKERQAMVIEKLLRVVRDNGVRADEKAAHEAFLRQRGEIRLSVGTFDPSDFTGKVAIDEKELSALYEKEKDIHRSENTYHMKYLVVDAKSGSGTTRHTRTF
jgi:hypothetical protein